MVLAHRRINAFLLRAPLLDALLVPIGAAAGLVVGGVLAVALNWPMRKGNRMKNSRESNMSPEAKALADRFAGYDLETCLRQAEAMAGSGVDVTSRIVIRELVGRLRESHRVKLSALSELERHRVGQ